MAFKYIVAVLALSLVFHGLKAQESLEVELDRYETMCRMSLELKARAAGGEQISRGEAEKTLGLLVDLNRRLKIREPEMTVVQRQRFKDIGEWFATGRRPYRPEELPALTNEFPEVLLSGSDSNASPYVCFPHLEVTEKHKKPSSAFLLAEVSAPDLSYGLRFGVLKRRVGGYASFRTNFIFRRHDYSCMMDGTLANGSVIWPNGIRRRSNLSINAGVLVRTVDWMDVYAGAGYGWRSLYWQDVGRKWAQVDDWSHRGMSVEAGAVFLYRRVAFSAGLSSISFKTVSFTMGVGLKF